MVEKILTEEQLAKKVEHCAKCLEIKFGGKDGRKHLVICGDTACVSSKSDEIYKRICEIIAERHLEDKVTINKVGCTRSATLLTSMPASLGWAYAGSTASG